MLQGVAGSTPAYPYISLIIIIISIYFKKNYREKARGEIYGNVPFMEMLSLSCVFCVPIKI